MRLTLAALSLAILLDACRIDPPPPPSPAPPGDGIAPGAARDGSAGGQFFCRTDRGERRALVLRKLALGVTTKPGTVRSHLAMELAGPPGERVEAVLRLAVPRGAAVTSAILWVNGRPMNGAFAQRDRARQIYRSIVERRRDPALVTWDGPGWVSVSIFPLERGESRRFELERIEPAATEAGVLQYRVPTIANAGRVLARPSVEVDGRPLATAGHDVVALATAGNVHVESCAVRAARRWEFPQLNGGDSAVVSCPFVLVPAREAAPLAPPHPPERPVEADLSTWGALVALAQKGELASRVEHVAAFLGLDRTSEPESLAWMIDRRGSDGREILLVARLLVAADRSRDAVRVLSEWAVAAPAAAAEELRRMGADADAAEVLALAKRGQ